MLVLAPFMHFRRLTEQLLGAQKRPPRVCTRHGSRTLLVTLAVMVAGCAGIGNLGAVGGGHGCTGNTLHGEWDQPGLFAAVQEAKPVGKVELGNLEPPRPHIQNETLNRRWGTIGLLEVSYRPLVEQGGRGQASIAHETWGGDGPLVLSVSVDRDQDVEDAIQLADTLLGRLGLSASEREHHMALLEEAWEPSSPKVANHLVMVPLEAQVHWDEVPKLVFSEAAPEADGFGDVRHLRDPPWSLGLKLGGKTIQASIDGLRVQLIVAPDDHVQAFARMPEGERLDGAFARINATLERAGLPPASLTNYEGAQATC